MTTALEVELLDLVNSSHEHAWLTFDWVKKHATTYGLDPKTVERWRGPGEPAFVSALLEYPMAPFRLSSIVRRHLEPFGLCGTTPLVSGVFIHQKPKVRLKGLRGSIELGDLLLVRQHFPSRMAQSEGRAFLLQAKSAVKPLLGGFKGKEAEQFALYSNWTKPFTFIHRELKGPPDGARYWNFQLGPHRYDQSGYYGLVSSGRGAPSSFPNKATWAIGLASSPVHGVTPSVDASAHSLDHVLAEFLLGRWGRQWEASPRVDDHWSSFVVECLNAAMTWKPYPNKRAGASFPRRRDALGLLDGMAASAGIRPGLEWLQLQRKEAAGGIAQAWRSALPHQDYVEPPWGENSPASDQPGGGLSVLYVATFGDAPLNSQTDLTDIEPKNPPNPLAGTW